MKINYGEKFKNSLKKIKKKHDELFTYEKIVNHIKQCNDFSDLSIHPISYVYGFEQLKHEYNGYYSFNLNKNGGTDRLIFSLCDNKSIILEYISTDHYKDFKRTFRGK